MIVTEEPEEEKGAIKLFVKNILSETTGSESGVGKAVAEQIHRITSSGKMKSNGFFGDARGGYIILNVNSAIELKELLRSPVLDNCGIECHPMYSIEEQVELLK